MFDNNVVEQIKERLGVAEIIGEYIKLEKSGVNYKALCPFHNEKTPSFTVNTERNFWYCFGCQEGGDIFNFIEKIEGLEFREVLERLAERTNIELPKFNTQKSKEEKSQKQKALNILELTTKIYQQQLIKHSQSAEILNYLKQRGFTRETIKDFKIGYAPKNWRAVVSYLLKKNFSLQDILNAGLIISKEGADKNNPENYYDRFRDRIMFPIVDVNGKVIGYSARIASGGDEKTAKYINSPQSLIYDKSKILYGLYQARQAIRQSGYVIIVEGNADVVLSHSIGIKNVVAVSGTALTETQVKLLKRYTNRVMLNFDMDGAGQKATKKSIQVCLQNDLQVKIILLSDEYKDVGDIVMIRPKDWRKFIKQAIPIMEYYFKTVFKNYKVNDIQDRKSIIKELLDVIKDIADPIEQAYWLKKLSLKTQTEEGLLTSALEKVKLNSRKVVSTEDKIKNGKFEKDAVKNQKETLSRRLVLQRRLLGLVVGFKNEIKKELANFVEDDYLNGEDLVVFKLLKENKDLGKYEKIANYYLTELTYENKKGQLVEVNIKPIEEWEILIQELDKEIKKEKLHQLELNLKKAEEGDDEKKIEMLMHKLGQLLKK